jgi:hypothetical protein
MEDGKAIWLINQLLVPALSTLLDSRNGEGSTGLTKWKMVDGRWKSEWVDQPAVIPALSTLLESRNGEGSTGLTKWKMVNGRWKSDLVDQPAFSSCAFHSPRETGYDDA